MMLRQVSAQSWRWVKRLAPFTRYVLVPYTLVVAISILFFQWVSSPFMSRRTTAAQLDLTRDYQFAVIQIKRALFFLIAFTGLIGAACVTGIPSITCYALADAYTIALRNLGALFFFEFLVICIVVFVERNSEDDFYMITNFSFWLRI